MVKQVIVIKTSFLGSFFCRNRMLAQGAHVSMMWLSEEIKAFCQQTDHIVSKWHHFFTPEQNEWINGLCSRIYVRVNTEKKLIDIYNKAKEANLTVYMITDAENTEFHGIATKTCLAIGPHEADKIDAITGHLKLL